MFYSIFCSRQFRITMSFLELFTRTAFEKETNCYVAVKFHIIFRLSGDGHARLNVLTITVIISKYFITNN